MVSGPLEKSQGPPHWQYEVCEVATCLDVCFEGVCVCVCGLPATCFNVIHSL